MIPVRQIIHAFASTINNYQIPEAVAPRCSVLF